MERLKGENIPVLPLNGIICEECMAFGIDEYGVIVSFLERDTGVVLTWEDIVVVCKAYLRDTEPEPKQEQMHEISIRKVEKPARSKRI